MEKDGEGERRTEMNRLKKGGEGRKVKGENGVGKVRKERELGKRGKRMGSK